MLARFMAANFRLYLTGNRDKRAEIRHQIEASRRVLVGDWRRQPRWSQNPAEANPVSALRRHGPKSSLDFVRRQKNIREDSNLSKSATQN
jgi:hypothetical protein